MSFVCYFNFEIYVKKKKTNSKQVHVFFIAVKKTKTYISLRVWAFKPVARDL